MRAIQVCTLEGRRHLFEDASDVVCAVALSVPDVLLTTVYSEMGWFKFTWKFKLEGDTRPVEIAHREIERRINLYNEQQPL